MTATGTSAVAAGTWTIAAERSRAVASARSATEAETPPTTRVVCGRRTASFSAAISSSVSPSRSVCSSAIEVSAVTFDGITLVASRRPPSPASITPASTLARARARSATAVPASNWVTRSPSSKPRSAASAASATSPTASANGSGSISAAPIRIRSDQRSRWGER